MQWGLSDAIGPILVGDQEHEVFLGREIGSRREVSESTAQLVDVEVKRVIDSAYERARSVLTEHSELLNAVATGLLERETLTRDDIDVLRRGEKLPPRSPSGIPTPPTPTPTPVFQPKPAPPPLLGGPEIAPA
jgi:cell division protease FtsH